MSNNSRKDHTEQTVKSVTILERITLIKQMVSNNVIKDQTEQTVGSVTIVEKITMSKQLGQ